MKQNLFSSLTVLFIVISVCNFVQAQNIAAQGSSSNVLAANKAANPSKMRRDSTGTWISVPADSTTNVHENSDKSDPSRRGLVITAGCPYSCKHIGLTSKDCREWQEGNSCVVEDLTQAPGHRSLLPVN